MRLRLFETQAQINRIEANNHLAASDEAAQIDADCHYLARYRRRDVRLFVGSKAARRFEEAR